MRTGRIAISFAVILLIGCSQVKRQWNQISEKIQPSTRPTTPGMIAQLDRAHGAAAWRAKKAFSAEFTVVCDGEETNGTMTFTTDGRRCRIDLAEGERLVRDGDDAWISPVSSAASKARVRLHLWPLLASIPFRLHDKNVFVTEAGTLPLGGRDRHVLRMTMKDAPDDWYILYPDLETGRLRAVAFLTKSVNPDAAPRAIVYDDFELIGGVQLAARGTLYDWTLDTGITGDPIGRARLRNVQFVDPPGDIFTKPDDAKELSPPATAPSATTQP